MQGGLFWDPKDNACGTVSSGTCDSTAYTANALTTTRPSRNSEYVTSGSQEVWVGPPHGSGIRTVLAPSSPTTHTLMYWLKFHQEAQGVRLSPP